MCIISALFISSLSGPLFPNHIFSDAFIPRTVRSMSFRSCFPAATILGGSIHDIVALRYPNSRRDEIFTTRVTLQPEHNKKSSTYRSKLSLTPSSNKTVLRSIRPNPCSYPGYPYPPPISWPECSSIVFTRLPDGLNPSSMQQQKRYSGSQFFCQKEGSVKYCDTSAPAPATAGVAMEVPLLVTSPQEWEALDPADLIDLPWARTSTPSLPSYAGPLPLKYASEFPPSPSPDPVAPTLIAFFDCAGAITVLAFGPLFPAAKNERNNGFSY
mmetsp:Transcript_2277/g.3492  ORF Transcript_2277/g.3492 Transcript_2277/m.3492 type:complete len:270 (+) Transcript_2277:348-1157(+)